MELYLISGITGFIGSHTAREILARGNRVRGLVRPTSRFDLIENLNIERVIGDITRPGTLKPALRGVDRVIHAAAYKACRVHPYSNDRLHDRGKFD